MKKKVLSIIFALIIVLGAGVPSFAESEVPDVTAQAVLVMDLTTGEVLYENNADEHMYPASLTKMLTGILVIENVSLGATLTADDEVAVVEPTALRMKSGEQINAKDALYCMLVASCNDLAELFAKYISGSVSEFAKLMNQKAEEIGCTNSHFVNPHGLHDDDHYTTARDLSKIVSYCMKNDLFRDIVKLSEYTYTRAAGAAKPGTTETVRSTNWLLYNTTTTIYVGPNKTTPKYEGCIGIKTGYTEEAGGCMIAAAERDGTTIVTIVLGSHGDSRGTYERAVDSIKLLDWGFENFRTVSFKKLGEEAGIVKVKGGEFNKVSAVVGSSIAVTLRNGESDADIRTELKLDESVKAPIERGAKCGTLEVYVGDVLRGSCDVVTASAVKKGGPLSAFGIEDRDAKKIFTGLGVLIALLVLAFLAYIVYLKILTERQRARKAAKARARRMAEEEKERF